MNKLKPVILSISALCTLTSANAFYVDASTPAGWVRAAGGTTFQASSTTAWIRTAEGVAAARVSSSVAAAGRVVPYPAVLRLAPSAGAVLARAAFGHPALFLALGVGSVAYDYFREKGFEVEGDKWVKRQEGDPDWEYMLNFQSPTSGWGSAGAACSWYANASNNFMKTYTGDPNRTATVYQTMPDCVIDVRMTAQSNPLIMSGPSYSTIGYYKRQRQAPLETVPATQEEMETAAQAQPLPETLPEGWPMALPPLPVLSPILNPSALPDLLPQTERIPHSNPTEVIPETVPKTYKTPVTDIIPANTDESPWRVDLQPKDIIKTDPSPITDGPVPTTTTPNPDVQEKPAEKTPGLCELYPDILACAKLGEAQAPKIPSKEVAVKVTPKTFSGGAGSCPAPLTFTFMTHTGEISYQPLCDQLSLLRALFLALAGVMAAYILADSFKVQ